MKFTTKTTEMPNDPGYWSYTLVEIFQDDIKIGQYQRNYSNFYNTFFPFEQDGKWYALYSRDYTATRIMSLPDCNDIGGEEPHSHGFCPTGFYVPRYTISKYLECGSDKEHLFRIYDDSDLGDLKEEGLENAEWIYENFGFVSGCVWGDDSSWKIEYLDLSDASKGIIKRDNRFGYIELANKLSLKNSFVFNEHKGKIHSIHISHKESFKMDGTKW